MKTTKICHRPGILLTFCWLLVCAGCFFSCDVLEPDPDILTPDVSIVQDQVFVYSGNATFIDLGAKVTSNQPVRFKVTTPPRSGSLSDLGMGLLQYTPSQTNPDNDDAFEFTIFSQKDEVIAVDTVNISVVKDSTKLPCGIYPVDDHIYGIRIGVPVVIPVLANDYICSSDSADVAVEVVHLSNSSPPYFGEARVVGQRIEYIAGSSFQHSDTIIYRVREKRQQNKPPVYGIVYLSATSNCDFLPMDDAYIFDRDSLSGIVELPALLNDSICQQSDSLTWRVVQSPRYGRASISENGFSYQVSDTVEIDSSFADQFRYELCQNDLCKTAVVDIRAREITDGDCKFIARPDSIDLSVNDIQLIYVDVMYNDDVCDGYSSFGITQFPGSGTAWISEEFKAIAYQRNPERNINDTLEYQICNAEVCSRAKVFIKREK